jgi:hypothetical protein
MTDPTDPNVDIDVPHLPTTVEPVDDGHYDMFVKAESKAQAIENVEEWQTDLFEAGIDSRVEYVGIDVPEDRCVMGGGAVHEVTLIVEDDYLDTDDA